MEVSFSFSLGPLAEWILLESVLFHGHLNSACFVSNLQLSVDLQAAEGLEMGYCLQPQHVHTDIAIAASGSLEV